MSIRINGKYFSKLVQTIQEYLPMLTTLNIGFNQIPRPPRDSKDPINYQDEFIHSLKRIIIESQKLIVIGLSGMNIRDRI
jgi:hypothetical protein